MKKAFFTVVVFLHEDITKNDYDYLLDVDTQDLPIIFYGTETQYEQLSTVLEKFDELQHIFINTDSKTSHSWYESITTPFWIVASPYEIWSEDILLQLNDRILESEIVSASLLYLVGFLHQKNGRVQYGQEIASHLRKPLSLCDLFDSAHWYDPLIKIIFRTSVIEEFRLIPECTESFFITYNRFCIRYLATLYQINAYTEPQINWYPGSFLLPKIQEPTEKEYKEVVKVLDTTKDIWSHNPWTKVYLVRHKRGKKL